MIALRCSELSCRRAEWTYGPSQVDHLSLEFREAALHFFCGCPGSGKTLLLHLLGLLEEPDSGSIEIFGQSAADLDVETRCEFRNSVFGYLFMAPCLLPTFSAAENIAMPLFRFAQADADSARDRVSEVLDRFGIEDIAGELSGNLTPQEQHLVALARAIVLRPRILVAISPGESEFLFPHVRKIVSDFGITCLWSDHLDALSAQSDRTLILHHGRVLEDRHTFS